MGKKSDAGQRALRNALLAGLGGAVLTLLLVLLAALLCKNGWLRQGREAFWARGALLLASLLAGIAASGKAKSGKLVCGGAAGGVLLFFVIILSLLSGNSTPINISLLWNVLTVLCGVFAGTVLTARGGRRQRKRR